MEVEGLTDIKTDDFSLSLDVNVNPSVLVSNLESLEKFLGEDKDLVFSEPRPTKLKSWINKQLKLQSELPEFINLYSEWKLKIKEKK